MLASLSAIECKNTIAPFQTATFNEPPQFNQSKVFSKNFKDVNEFNTKCLLPNSLFKQQLQFNQEVKKTLLTPNNDALFYTSFNSSNSDFFKIVIIDIKNTPNDVLYIDFFNYDKLVNSTDSNRLIDDHLIIFVKVSYTLNVRLLNLPGYESERLKKLTILFYPECNVYYTNNFENDLKFDVEVKHAPSYYDLNSDENIVKNDWFKYLRENFLTQQKKEFYVLESIVYMCNVAFVKIDLSRLVDELASPELSTLSHQAVYHLEEYSPVVEDNSPDVITHCVLTRTEPTRQVVLVNVEHNKHRNNLRIFLNACSNDEFLFVFHVVNYESDWRNMSIVVIDNDCPVKIISNVEVKNSQDETYNEFEYLDLSSSSFHVNLTNHNDSLKTYELLLDKVEAILEQSSSSSSATFNTHKLEMYKNFQINDFYLWETNPKAIEVQITFTLKGNSFNLKLQASKFIEDLKQRTFLIATEKDNESDGLIKLSVPIILLEDYFKAFRIDFSKILNNNMQAEEEIHFFLTHKRCKSFLNYRTQFGEDEALVFNLNLSDKSCFFLDQFSMLLLTFSIEITVKNYSENFYFIFHVIGNSKYESASLKYYDSMISSLRKADYELNSKINMIKPVANSHELLNKTHNNFFNLQINSKLKFKTLDNLLIWSVDHCWLADRACVTSHQMIENELPDEDEASLADDDLDESSSARRKFKLSRVALNQIHHTSHANHTALNSNHFLFGFEKFTSEYKKIGEENCYYEAEISFQITIINFEVDLRKQYFMCNLKPCGAVNLREPKKCVKENLIFFRNENLSEKDKELVETLKAAKLKTFILFESNPLMNQNDSTYLNTEVLKLEKDCSDLNQIVKAHQKLNISEHISYEHFLTDKPILSTTSETKTEKITTRKSNSEKSNNNNNNARRHFLIKLIEWIDENKLTLLLILTIFFLTALCLVVLKMVSKKFYECPDTFKPDQPREQSSIYNELQHSVLSGQNQHLISPIFMQGSEQKQKLLNNNNNNTNNTIKTNPNLTPEKNVIKAKICLISETKKSRELDTFNTKKNSLKNIASTNV